MDLRLLLIGGLRRARGDRGSGKWAIGVVGVGSPVSLLLRYRTRCVRTYMCKRGSPKALRERSGGFPELCTRRRAATRPPAARNEVHSDRFGRPSTGAERVAVARKRPRRRRGLEAVLRNAAALQIDGCACWKRARRLALSQSLLPSSGNTLARTCENDGGLPKRAALDGWGAPADRPELSFAGGSPPRGKTPPRQPSRPGAR